MARKKSATETIALGIGANLRRYRTDRGLSQEKLAMRVGMSRETIRRTEAGVAIPEWGSLEKMATALEVSLWDLLPRRPRDRYTSYSSDNAWANAA